MNSRPTKWAPVFKTGGLNRSPTPPATRLITYGRLLGSLYQLMDQFASPQRAPRSKLLEIFIIAKNDCVPLIWPWRIILCANYSDCQRPGLLKRWNTVIVWEDMTRILIDTGTRHRSVSSRRANFPGCESTLNLSAKRYGGIYVPFLNMRVTGRRPMAHSQACKKYGSQEYHRPRHLRQPILPSQTCDQTRTIVD